MSYTEDLLTQQWNERRREILQRDFCRCQLCNNIQVIKNTTKVEFVGIREHSNNYRVYYINPIKKLSENIFFSKSFAVLNPLYRENLRPYLFELYKETVEGIETVIAIKEKDTDIESVLSKANNILKKNNHPLLTINSPSIEYLRKIEEEQGPKRWLLVPGLNVHHKYYVTGKKPWEYKDDALVTLCKHCHSQFHQSNKVPIYRSDGHPIQDLTPCSRCEGHGILPQYIHVENGICFRCRGSCYDELFAS
jgi:5-methylcytosine-specific restriction endonuclease McrA